MTRSGRDCLTGSGESDRRWDAVCCSSSSFVIRTNPGVQKPHWNPPCDTNACCIGCRTPFSVQSLDGDDIRAIDERGQIQASRHGRAVDDHGAAATESLPAALARAEQCELPLQDLDHRVIDRNAGRDRTAVEREARSSGEIRLSSLVLDRAAVLPRESPCSTRSGVSGRSLTTIPSAS